MHETSKGERVLTDASRLITESLARAGADAFIGYPITPANLLYKYASERMPLMLAAPDEITTLQWMTGLAATGKLPVTATSFPGYALMIESINMAFMMELPMVIVLVQRLGPATGTATCGAQGDLSLLRGQISGGHSLPVLATCSFQDCWELPAEAVKTAIELRTPVVLLTSKEEVMTTKSFDPNSLKNIRKATRKYGDDASGKKHKPYQPAANLVPWFLPVNQQDQQVRLTASTHDQMGLLQHSTEEALDNTLRLEKKAKHSLDNFTFYEYHQEKNAENLVVSWGITAPSARVAVSELNHSGEKTSLLIPKTLLPTPQIYPDIIHRYQKVIIAEENLNNQLGDLLWGMQKPSNCRFAGSLGKMITPNQIIEEVRS
jgi:2-oxoglutarate ferredoxin oxidoreductase subunit alpha